jgi:hypothetical protein
MTTRKFRSILAAAAVAAICAPAASQPKPPTSTGVTRPVVDWSGAVGGLRQSGGRAGRAATGLDQAAVDRTRLPILLPDGPGFSGARIYSFGDYYAISADTPGAGIALTGTTTVVLLPGTSRLTMPAAGVEQLVVQRTVDGQLASFVRYGVLYTVEVRCDLASDERCRGETFVRDLVARTRLVVMGKAARQAAGLGG